MNKKIFLTITAFTFGFAIFNLASSKKVEAATCTWVGGSGINWSTAANWDGNCSGAGGIPVDGDSVNFDSNGVKPLANNDLGPLVLADINITDAYDLLGNDISITNSISCSDYYSFEINVTLTNTATFKDCNFTGVIDLNGNTLNLQQSVSHWIFHGFISGSGTISTNAGSWVDLLGGATNDVRNINLTTSTMSLAGGGWDSTEVHLSNGGVFYGDGQNVALVTSDGSFGNIVSPSYPGVNDPPPDIMHIGGDITLLTSNDQIRMVIADTSPTGFDQIQATGNVTLGNATFYLSPHSDFVGQIGDTFTIINAASVTGTFDGLPDGAIINSNMAARYQIHYTVSEVTLTIVSGYCTWNGSSDNLWSNGANWDSGCSGSGGVPDHGDQVTFDGTSNQDTQNDLGLLTIFGMDFLTPGFSIDGDGLAMSHPLLATEQADINVDVELNTPDVGAHNFGGILTINDQIGITTFHVTRDMEISGTFEGCYPSMHIIFDGPHQVNLSGGGSYYCRDITTTGGGELFVNSDYSNNDFIVSGGSTISGTEAVKNLTIQSTGTLHPIDLAGDPSILRVEGDLTFLLGSNMILDAFGNEPSGPTGYAEIIVHGTIDGFNIVNTTITNTLFATNTDVLELVFSAGGFDTEQITGIPEGTLRNFGVNLQAHYTSNAFGFRGLGLNVANTIFSSNPTNPDPGQDFIITTTWNGNGPEPTGTVELFDGSTSLGTAFISTLNHGTETFTITGGLPAGAHNLTVQYFGDLAYDAAVSSQLVLQVGAAAVDPGTLPNTGINLPINLIVLIFLATLGSIFIFKKYYY